MTTQLMGRKEAAAYLTRTYHRISHYTLARHAMSGSGPKFRYSAGMSSGVALYSQTDLDEWWNALSMAQAKTQQSRPVKAKLPPMAREKVKRGGAMAGIVADL